MAEIAKPIKKTPVQLDEETLIEIKKYVHEKRMLIKHHPESADYQALKGLEDHVDRRLSEIAWTRYKKQHEIDFE